MAESSRIIISLLLGLLLGVVLRQYGNDGLIATAQLAVVVGELWLRLLQMSVLPLLVSLLITGVCGAREQAGRQQLALQSLWVFGGFLLAATLVSAIAVPLALQLWPVDPAAATALRDGVGASTTAGEAPPLSRWLVDSLPSNPFQSAAEGAVLPLVVFVLFFALAAARLDPLKRAPIVAFFDGAAEALLTVVKAVLRVAVIGVFGLALGVGLRGGTAVAGAIAHYLILVCALAGLLIALLYPAALVIGRLSLKRFASAAAPAQAVAFSTQSSLASLPAMLQATRDRLNLPAAVVDVALPLAVSLFKYTSPALNLAVVLFVAHVLGVEIGVPTLLAGMAVALVTSIGVAGIPGQASFLTTTVPIAAAMGVPNELLFLLLAVEVIPDLFRTIGNVSADILACAVLTRLHPSPTDEPTDSD